MSPRIAYWTHAFELGMEAIANEVGCLRRAYPGSICWGISSTRGLRFSREHGYSAPPRWQLAFRAATWLCQGRFDIQHLYGGLGDWFHLKAVCKRPTILTMAVDGTSPPRLLDKIDRFVVEWPAARDELFKLGIAARRVDLVFPPVDVARFMPAPKPELPFRVLFSSSPERSDWLAARGVPQLLDVAALRPDMRFIFLWRPWGDSLPPVLEEIKRRNLNNVEVHLGRFNDMSVYYNQAHVAVALFTDAARCKPVPNSLLESMACGRPVLATPLVGLAEIIEQHQSGLICQPDPAAISAALDRLRADWEAYSTRARELAVRLFGQDLFLSSYRRIYAEVLDQA